MKLINDNSNNVNRVSAWTSSKREKVRVFNSSKVATGGASSGMIFRILLLILSLLLIANIFRQSFSGNDLSFTSFLSWLGSVDNISINFSIESFYIGGNWGILDGLRSFFNIFTQLFGVIVYLGSQLINLVIFLGQFIAFLFA